jgi:HK97 family phage portal protein
MQQTQNHKKSTLVSVLRRGVMASIGTAESGFFPRWGWNTGESWSGKSVTVDSALQNDAVWSCVKLISEAVSTLPLGLYRRVKDGGREMAADHPLYDILHNSPSARMSAVNYWQAVSAALLLWGNSYSEIVRNGTRVTALEFLKPHLMRLAYSQKGELEYHYAQDGKTRQIAHADMMHIKSFSLDGEVGLSAIQYGRNAIARAQATNQASDETFKEATRASGIVTVDAVLKPEQREAIRKHVDTVSKAGGVYVLEKGAGFAGLRFNPVDAELIASQNLSIEQICRIFRTPPVLIGHYDKASSWPTSTEAQGALFVRYVLRSCLTGIEQEISRSLLTAKERINYFAKFSIEGLLRGSSAERAAFYVSMVSNAIMTRDEVRSLEELPAMGGNAAVLTLQSAMINIEKMAEPVAAAANPAVAAQG